MRKLPRFFDWHGELGRVAYFVEAIKRIPAALFVFLLSLGLYALAGWIPFSPETSWQHFFHQPFLQVGYLIIFVPITIKRLNDANISLWWLFFFEALNLVPFPPSGSPRDEIHTLLVGVPYLLWGVVVCLMPGKAWFNSTRNKGNKAKGKVSNARITYSD